MGLSLLVWLAAFSCGILAGQAFPELPLTLPNLALLFLPILALRRFPIAAVAFFLLAGAGAAHRRAAVPDDHLLHRRLAEPAAMEGVVVSEPVESFGTVRFTLSVKQLATEGRLDAARGLVLTTTPLRAHIQRGDVVRVETAAVSPVRSGLNPGERDPSAWLKRHGVHLEARAESVAVISRSRSPVDACVTAVRRRIRASLDRWFAYLPEEKLLIETITAGRKPVPPFLRDIGVRSGTYHLLVVSGLHVGFVVLLVRALLFPFFGPRHRHPKAVSCILLAAIWFYACLTGLHVPVARAAVMFSFVLLSDLIEQDIPPLASLGAAALVLLVADPSSLFDPGFQLSFAATCGIFVVPRWLRDVLPAAFPLKRLVSVTFGAYVCSLPIILFHFQKFYPLAFFNNLIAVPVAGIATVSGIAFLLAPFPGFYAARLAADGMLRLLTVMAQHSVRVVLPLSLPGVGASYGVLALILGWRHRAARYASLAITGLCLAFGLFRTAGGGPLPERLTIFSVPRDTAALIESRGQAAFIYAGRNPDRTMETVLAPCLALSGRSGIDTFIWVSQENLAGDAGEFAPAVPARQVVLLPSELEQQDTSLAPEVLRERAYTVGGISLRIVPSQEKTRLTYAFFVGPEDSIVLAQYIGEQLSARLSGRRVFLLYAQDASGRKAVRDNLASVRTIFIVVLKPYKKFAVLPEATAGTLSLAEGAVTVDLSGRPWRILRGSQRK